MTRECFSEFLAGDVIPEIIRRLDSKGNEYASDEQFHNFIEGGKRKHLASEQYLLALNCKQEVSRDDIVDAVAKSGVNYYANQAVIEEKLYDIICYQILLLGMIKEKGVPF